MTYKLGFILNSNVTEFHKIKNEAGSNFSYAKI